MLDRARHSVGLLAARFHFRKWAQEPISFVDAVTSARRILLIMPLDGSQLFPVAPLVTMLRSRCPDEDITIVVTEHGAEALEVLRRSPVIRILPPEVSLLFFPSRDVIARVTQQKYDMAIDLNLDFQLPSGYICRESNARIRVGFVTRRADTFYNFQVQTSPGESAMQRYERLAHCLEMF